MALKKVTLPLTDEKIETLEAGDEVLLTGVIYTARDAAHARMIESMDSLPFDLRGQVIYYSGASPAKPGAVIGACGPTTSGRMDGMTPVLLDNGLKGMIGKGNRNDEVIQAIVRNKAVYFIAIGGAGALIANSVKESEVIAYEDLGPEAVKKMVVENMKVIVAIDSSGRNLYEEGVKKYKIL
jgi:fumarate hydratase subunit beta